MESHDVLVIGAGVAGLAAGWALDQKACVLEAEARPGGLVKTEKLKEYWFDHVLHLLHLSDPPTEKKLKELMSPMLVACPPEAWVECSAGTARYPIQNHLGTLDPDAVQRILSDFRQESMREDAAMPTSHREMLLRTFGRSLCEIFFFPYHQKVWKRSLESLSPTGFQWNIARPDLEEVERGAQLLGETDSNPYPPELYNHNGWYPRSTSDDTLRGMELLTREMVKKVDDLRVLHRVVDIDCNRQRVRLKTPNGESLFHYRDACVATLPLPNLLRICSGVPKKLRNSIDQLEFNRVRSVMIGIRGPRPKDPGLWRYYADESLVFSRLAFMTEFDPLMAPEDGFGILAEITERGDEVEQPDSEVIERVVSDLKRLALVKDSDQIECTKVLSVSPAYVVFSDATRGLMEEAQSFFLQHGIHLLGRYGRWEYSSIESVIRDGLACGASILEAAESQRVGAERG